MSANNKISLLSTEAYKSSFGYHQPYDFNKFLSKFTKNEYRDLVSYQFRFGERYSAKLFLFNRFLIQDLGLEDWKKIFSDQIENEVYLFDLIQFLYKFIGIDAIQLFISYSDNKELNDKIITNYLNYPGVLIIDKGFVEHDLDNYDFNEIRDIKTALLKQGVREAKTTISDIRDSLGSLSNITR